MASGTLPKGITVSFSNTPQATTDNFTAAQTGLGEDSLLGLVLLDVMANDLGGNAKSLYSLDDGSGSGGPGGDLLVQDAIGMASLSAHGATIKITADGKVSYDATTLDAAFKSDLQHLSAGEFATDTFTYAIRLGNGTLSWTTATVQIAGENDAPVAANIGTDANEDTGNPVVLTASFTDADTHDTHAFTIDTTGTKGVVTNNSDGTFSYDPNGQFESLSFGESATDTFTYTVIDNHGGASTETATVTIHGENDAVAAASVAANANEDGGNPVLLAASYTDLDAHDTHTFAVNTAGTKGTVVNLADGTFSYDPHGQFESLAFGETATDTFAYTVTDNHGASSTNSATVTIHGENDAPVLQNAVPGDQALDPSTGLTLTATMAFADLDLLDTHSVTFTALTSGSIGSFTPVIGTDSTHSGHGSVGLSYQLTPAQFMAAGGNIPTHQDYRVTIDDHHGGISSQDVSIPLAQILSGIGGGGGGPPTVRPPVFTIISPPAPYSPGQNQGQIVDNPFVLHQSFIPQGGFIGDPTNLFTQGTLNFLDPDGGHHHASVDLAHAFVFSHFVAEPGGGSHSAGNPTITTSTGTWQFDVRDDLNQVHWSYTLNESAIRSMVQGEWLTMVFPVTVFEDGVGQSTTNVRIDVLGTDEPTSMLPPDTVLTATTDITPYLLPIDLATHVQTQTVSITEDPLVTGSTLHHTVSGTLSYVDPDRLNVPTVSMTLTDPGAPLTAEVQSVRDGFSYTVESFGNYGMIHWTFDVQDSELDFLPQNSTLTAGAIFNIGAIPGGPGGGGSLSTVNVTLHGSNDAPVIQGSTTTFADVALNHSTSGSITATDPDGFPDGQFVVFVPHNSAVHGAITGQTIWNYTATDFGTGTLVAGQHDVWDMVVHDQFGATATHALDFHIV